MSRLAKEDSSLELGEQLKPLEKLSINEIFRGFIKEILTKERVENEIKYIVNQFGEHGINIKQINPEDIKIAARARLETLVALAFKIWIKNHPKLGGIKPWALLGGAAVEKDSKTWESVTKIVEYATAYGITTATGGGTGVMEAPLLSESASLPGISIKLGGLPEEQVQISTEIEVLLETFTIRQSLLL
jgi:hypothetical protein